MNTALKIIAQTSRWFCILLLLSLTCVTFTQVIARYVFGSSIYWAEEFARICLVWLTFMGAVVVLGADKHIRITFLMESFSERRKAIFEIISDIICTVFLVWLVIKSSGYVLSSINVYTTALEIPRSYLYGALPFSAILMAIQFIFRIIMQIRYLLNTSQSQKNIILQN